MLTSVLFFSLLLLYHGESVKVQVEQGWLEGAQWPLVTGDGQYYSFKGVPYAAPPLGKLRFKAPQPAVPWEGTRNATEHGSVCIQYNIFTNRVVPGSEDCLFLNVYTTDLSPKSPRPVMVYIHGGGYKWDSGNVDNYGPDFLVNHNIVLVTFNYRLEVLGFLSLDTVEVPGNAGMKDQVAALKWVQKNIQNFGGNPNDVTIFGQSAGGASVIYHMVSAMSKGLFKKAISMSGVPSCDWSIPYEPRKRAFVLGKEIGINTNDPMELFDYLQNVAVEKLIGTSPSVLITEEISGNILKMFHFVPVVEKDFGQDRFLTEDPLALIKTGVYNKADLMIGHTSEEGIGDLVFLLSTIISTYSKYAEMLVPRKILIRSPPENILDISDSIRGHYFGNKVIGNDTVKELLDYINDSSYNYDIYRYIRAINEVSKSKLYVYRFSAVTSRNIYGEVGAKYGLIGATHLDDTVYLFDPKQANLTIVKNSVEYKIVEQTCKLFTNFAKHSNPTPDASLGALWPEYDNIKKSYMDIGETLTTGRDLDGPAAKFWKSILEKSGLVF